jgi:Cu(I)/Ag(I) efflux system membrane fusion protein
MRQLQVFAPFSGQISDLFGLETGEIARLQYPLVRLVDTSKVNFITHIEARLSDSIKPGDQVQLEIRSGESAAKFAGSVAFVSPVIESSSGLLRVRVAFDNPDGKIRPGASGTMRW